jgi:hypothetical protein
VAHLKVFFGGLDLQLQAGRWLVSGKGCGRKRSWPDMYRPVICLEGLRLKVKISLLQAVEAHRVARGRGSHIT